MTYSYFPILKALAAEFVALEHTSNSVANSILPLFEIPKLPNRKALQKSATPVLDFLNSTVDELNQIWHGRSAMLDIFHWNPSSSAENGEHILSYLHNSLVARGINTIPVVGYDRWDQVEYQIALSNIIKNGTDKTCIRLESNALGDAAEPEFFIDNVSEIIDTFGINPTTCHVILDFEDITMPNIPELIDDFDMIFQLLKPFNFRSYSIAGCSLPKTIDKAVSKTNSVGTVLRKEMLLWKNAREQYEDSNIYFGDYGVRGPNSAEGIPNPNTNGKIRYTKDNEFFIARGHSMKVAPKGMQHCLLADKVINSPYYTGPNFSWGDKEIENCKNGDFGGNAQRWIKIDTNHHLAFVVEEVKEYERTLFNRKARSTHGSITNNRLSS